MKKIIFISALAVYFVLTGTSCKKCKDCQEYVYGTKHGDPIEFCDSELSKKEAMWNEATITGFICY